MHYYCGVMTAEGEIFIPRDSEGHFLIYGASPHTCHVAIPSEPQINNLGSLDALDATDIATVFSWGFGCVVVLGYFSGLAIGVARKLINLT